MENGNSLVLATPLTAGPVPPNQDNSNIRRSHFPPGFVFGTGTSAFQVEGAAAVDGKGPSIWDHFTLSTPGNIQDGSNGNVACDMYNRYKDDIRMMKSMGFDAYRFSISWPRILPGGRACAGINREGIKYYNDLIDTVIANGMKPYVTLFHWDTPDTLQKEYGGFLSKKIVDDFRAFAELCFFEFGDRVKWWTTLNEPHTYAMYGYVSGTMPPGHKSNYNPTQAVTTRTSSDVTGPIDIVEPNNPFLLSSRSGRRTLLGGSTTIEEEIVNTLPPYRSDPPNNTYTLPPYRSDHPKIMGQNPFLLSNNFLFCSSGSTSTQQETLGGPKEAYTVSRNLLLAHSAAVHSYRTKFKEAQRGVIGIVLSSNWAVPYDKDSEDDKKAAKRAIDFMLGWYLEPVLKGKYPDSMTEYVPAENLAKFSPTEFEQLTGSTDYVGFNFYTANYVRNEPNLKGQGYDVDKRLSFPTRNKEGEEMGEDCGSTWLRVVPWAIYEHLVYLKNKYSPDLPPIYITENGVSQNNDHRLTATAACEDPIRVRYHQDHLANILQAINFDKMNIRGYIAWSWCDNFEWTQGYTVRFGLTYVDYMNNLTRHPKNSALWFAKFLVKAAQNKNADKRQIEDNSAEQEASKKPRLAQEE